MLHVVDQIEQLSEGVEYKNQLLGVLKSNKVWASFWGYYIILYILNS